ncbi:bifunctional adenosylcobinamide kinase/adenosylcobinamide-phosphate guanylyltransferase [Magnetospira thiophila]
MTEALSLPPLTLILGGIRSGKSAYGESLIEAAGGGIYLATAEARDTEMRARIQKHRERRGSQWQTIEAPLDLLSAIQAARRPVLVDCLTLWLSNLVEAKADVTSQVRQLSSALLAPPVPVVLISNEVGLGGIAAHPMARGFADLQGATNQIFAEVARRVVLITAGLPLTLKDATSP